MLIRTSSRFALLGLAVIGAFVVAACVPGFPAGPTLPPAPEEGPTDLPEAEEACPTMVTPAEGPFGRDFSILGRQARIWVASDARTRGDGPLVFYWTAFGSVPGEANVNFREVIDGVVAAGGAVVSLYREEIQGGTVTSGIPWWYVEDLEVADEVVACAIEEVGIDTRRIHAAGTSAGGVHAAQMGFRRSNYVASVATYSGGMGPGAYNAMADPNNEFAALITYADGDFMTQFSLNFAADLDAKGHFNILCEHGGGHGIAPSLAPSVWQFFQDHSYEVTSPWASQLPANVHPGCLPT